jgi:CubicO group peptidase (beta-lactamase class C family)
MNLCALVKMLKFNFVLTAALLALGLSLLFSTQLEGAQTQSAQQALTADISTTKLQKDIPLLMKEAGVPGLSMGVITNGHVVLQSFGVADAKTNAPVTEDTIFNAASLSKTVFAYGVLKLVDQGKLGLDVPLTTYLPKPYIEGDERLQKITARFVLSHRAGFPNWRGNDPLKIYFTPGERFSYSGEGMVYLQKVVEQITGQRLNEYMQETVFGPLAMSTSSYVWRKDFETHAATGHDSDGGTANLLKPDEAVSAASLETTARDYATFLAAVLAGRGLKPATLREMETPQIAVDPECTNCTTRAPKELSKELFWGLGWGIQKTGQGDSLWHWGDNGAYKAYVVARPDTKSAVVMFANSENGLSIARAVVAETLGGDQPAFDWLKYDNYDSPGMRFAVVVREKGAAAALKEFSSALSSGAISEVALNQEGYHLMGGKHLDDAILIFQKNAELHPASSNVYDSLAEAYMNNHQNDLSIKNYEKSLELDSSNMNAAAMLKKLRGK